MAVGPVTLNGVIQRTQDISAFKQQEDAKPMVEQQNIQAQMKMHEMRQSKQVTHADNADEHQKKYDAKEKGSNEYRGQKKKKKKPEEQESKEINRAVFQREGGRFDMKI